MISYSLVASIPFHWPNLHDYIHFHVSVGVVGIPVRQQLRVDAVRLHGDHGLQHPLSSHHAFR